jgi:signal transduction histidine kinase
MPQDRVANPVQNESFPIVVATTPASVNERRLATIFVICFAAVTLTLGPFANIPLARLDAFVPVIQTVMCVADLVTAALLFSQYSVEQRVAILAVAAGYIASGLFSFFQTLAFPGAYSPDGLIGDGRDSSAWLFVFWHSCFPLAILTYAFLKDRAPRQSGQSFVAPIVATFGGVALAFSALSWIALKGTGYLPSIYVGGDTRQTLLANLLNLYMGLWAFTALAVLFLRRSSVLDLWLMVTLCAWMPNFVAGALMTTYRFSVGWYMVRGFALIASCTVLIVLLTETTVLYARLANVIVLLRRERGNRLMSLDAATAAMAHELRQPLTAIAASGASAINWMNRVPPELEEARTCVSFILDSNQRAEEIIAGVRDLFKKRTDHRTELRINDIVGHVLRMLRPDLEATGIYVETTLQEDLPVVHADRILLQQVILNLIRNAIEAMALTTSNGRHLRLATKRNGQTAVLLSVQDRGLGITAEESIRVFEPFFTTKSSGMGLGLSICKTIVEDHGGELRLAEASPSGCTFEMVLPAGGAAQDEVVSWTSHQT